jgi:hypothetical protein
MKPVVLERLDALTRAADRIRKAVEGERTGNALPGVALVRCVVAVDEMANRLAAHADALKAPPGPTTGRRN